MSTWERFTYWLAGLWLRHRPCERCDGTGCPCARWRDWWSMDDCECGCANCGRKPAEARVSLGER